MYDHFKLHMISVVHAGIYKYVLT